MNRSCAPLLGLLLALSLVTSGLAQNATVGVKAGIDFADLGGDFEDVVETSTDLRTGFSVGGFLGVDLHRLFRLQGEVQYVQKGAKATADGIEGDFKLSYVEILAPLTLLVPVEGTRVQPRFYAGPSLAFELSCDITLEGGGMDLEFDCENAPPEADIEAETKSVDFGIFFGGGVDIPAGRGVVSLDVLYDLGLTDIDDSDPVIDIKNRNIQILAGYGFTIGP